MKFDFKIVLLLVVAALWSCSDEPGNNEPNPRHDIELSRGEADVVASTNDFALGLLAELNKNNSGNFVISPMSVAMDLGMLANGANGQTLDQIMNVLIGSSDGNALQEANSMFETVLNEFPNLDKKVEVSFANGFISGNGYKLSTGFAEAAGNYDMEMIAAGSDMQATIDSWVANKTKNQIKSLPLGLDGNREACAFLNAMYFKGEWMCKFDKKQTVNRTFYGLKGNSEVPMMHDAKHEMWRASYGCFTTVILDYGNGAYYMQIIMPDSDIDFGDAMIELCKEGMFEHLQVGYRPTEEELQDKLYEKDDGDAEIYLPKFKVESEFALMKPLNALGIINAFDYGNADFKGIFADGYNSYITDVKHKAIIEVDEEGTVVVAATGSGMEMLAPLGKDVIVDHPFFFFVRELSTGAILAMGQITDL